MLNADKPFTLTADDISMIGNRREAGVSWRFGGMTEVLGQSSYRDPDVSPTLDTWDGETLVLLQGPTFYDSSILGEIGENLLAGITELSALHIEVGRQVTAELAAHGFAVGAMEFDPEGEPLLPLELGL